MNWKTAMKNAALTTVVTMFVTTIIVAMLTLSGGKAFMAAEISIPFVFFGLNLLLFVVLKRINRKRIAVLVQICANLVLLTGYVVLLHIL